MQAWECVSKWIFKDKKIAPILLLLVKVFALKQLLTETEGLYECGYFTEESPQLIDDSLQKLLIELRPHMVPLVESFAVDSSDYNVIGNRYGDIYELQLETSRQAPINKVLVPSYYHKYMKPCLNMYKGKL